MELWPMFWAQIPLRRLCDKVGDVRKLCRLLSPCIVTDQIPLERHKWVSHGLCRSHLDMSKWFVFATFIETS